MNQPISLGSHAEWLGTRFRWRLVLFRIPPCAAERVKGKNNLSASVRAAGGVRLGVTGQGGVKGWKERTGGGERENSLSAAVRVVVLGQPGRKDLESLWLFTGRESIHIQLDT